LPSKQTYCRATGTKNMGYQTSYHIDNQTNESHITNWNGP
jgi:hypothetical protein